MTEQIKKLKDLCSQIVEFDSDLSIDENTIITRDMDLNSLDFMQLICLIEDEYDIEIPDKKIKTIITVGDLIEFINSEQGK